VVNSRPAKFRRLWPLEQSWAFESGGFAGVEQQDGNIIVDMTMTTPGCPLHESMLQGVGDALSIFPAVKRVEVRLVWEPLWTPDRITEEGRQALGWAA
jgi:metal-sulfur cluster biosynthetic enzyme